MPTVGRTTRIGSAGTLILGSLTAVAVLIGALVWLSQSTRPHVSQTPLTIYCAAGMRSPVEEAARQFETEYSVRISIHYGSSGQLEQQIAQRQRGDLYIPAAVSPFLDRLAHTGMVQEQIRLAGMKLVLAVQPGNPKNIRTLDDLLRGGVNYILANEQAAVGKTTREALTAAGRWDEIRDGAKVFKPTVTEVVNDIRLGGDLLDAGFVWDVNARDAGLTIVELPELADLTSVYSYVTAAVLNVSKDPTAALRLARYLAAPEKGGQFFRRHHFTAIEGDPWAEVPTVKLYSGGVNRLAIQGTIDQFQRREGCRVNVVYGGCGTLVGMMKAGELPDAYFACDLSFLNEVREDFRDPLDVSQTDMVILVQPGNPKNIRSLLDLGRPDVRIGIADEKLTALGHLTVRLLKEVGVYDQVIANRVATTPTADLLVTQLVHSELDAVIVYRANCSQVRDRAEIISVEHPAARAIQPFAIQKQPRFPQLTERLLNAVLTPSTREQFERVGFQWLATPSR